MLDGGVPLVLLYCGALAGAFYVAGRAAMDRNQAVGSFGAMVFAYDVGALAMTFNYPIFISQAGMEFWILNAALFAVWASSRVRLVAVPSGRMEISVPAKPQAALPARRPLPALPSLPRPAPAMEVAS